MDVESLRKLVKKYDKKWKGVKLLEELLKQYNLLDNNAKEVIEFWRKIISSRNCSYPYHRENEEKIMKILKDLSLTYPMDNWQLLWNKLFKDFVDSFRILRGIILQLTK